MAQKLARVRTMAKEPRAALLEPDGEQHIIITLVVDGAGTVATATLRSLITNLLFQMQQNPKLGQMLPDILHGLQVPESLICVWRRTARDPQLLLVMIWTMVRTMSGHPL